MVEQLSAPQGYEVVGFQDGPTALEAARRMTPALIIADYHLASMTFSGFCKEVTKLEHLTETVLLCLVDASDRLDEQHLRGLGVRAFLKKPLQSDHLLDAIKELKNGTVRTSTPTPSLKKRAWPPDSTATDLEDQAETPAEIEGDSSPDCGLPAKEELPMTPPISGTSDTTAGRRADNGSSSGTASGEKMIRGLLDYLLQSVLQQAEQKISELVPLIVAKELPVHMNNAVREAVQNQMTAALSTDRIEAAARAAILSELPKQTASQLAAMETSMRQHLAEIAPPLVEQTSEKVLRQMTDAGLEKHVPQAVRDHLGPVEMVVKNEVREAVARCAQQTIEEIVRETAREPIQQAVQLIVPDIAEAHIKEEIKRLTAPE
jgi:CheY-like chemotaxis protein